MTRPKKNPLEPAETREPDPSTFTHPLLPGGAGADGKELPPPRVARFYVTRKNDKTGAWEFAPQQFGEHDLPGPEALFATYGGGLYWIRGQSAAGSWIAPFGVWPLAGASKPLHPAAEPEPPPVAPSPIPTTPTGGFDMGAMFMLILKQQGDLLTALITRPAPAPPPPDTLSRELLTALVQRGSPDETGRVMDKVIGAWKDGLGVGTEAAKIAQEAAAAGGGTPEPSGLDKALDAVAPVALGKMVDKVLGGGG